MAVGGFGFGTTSWHFPLNDGSLLRQAAPLNRILQFLGCLNPPGPSVVLLLHAHGGGGGGEG